MLLLVPLATNSLNGVRVVEYATLAEAQAAQTAGYISAATLVAITAAFAQSPAIESIKVGYADLAGSPAETYATALTACIAFDPDFYGVCIFVRTATEIAAVGALVETNAKKMLFVFQSADSSWLDSGIPSGFSAMAAYERSGACYHDTATEWADVAFACNRLSFDPDSTSAPWHGCTIAGVAAYSTTPTSTQAGFIRSNNANVFLPYATATFSPDPGVNLNGRAISEIISADWFATRVQEEIARIVLAHGDRGEKIGVNAAGQAIILAGIEKWLKAGVDAGHFEEGQVLATPETISTSDITNRRIRITVRVQNVVPARLFTINVYASDTAIA